MSALLNVEEAVSLMVDMDYIPDGETVLSMTDAFLEEAIVEFENASANDMYLKSILKMHMDACEARYKLALTLTALLTMKDALISCKDEETDDNPLMSFDNLSRWAYDRFGISISNKKIVGVISNENVEELKELISSRDKKTPSWKEVTIKIYADYKIGYSIDNKNWKRSSFIEIGLMGKRKLEPNELGGILIGLSIKQKYPTNGIALGGNKTAISKINKSLVKLTGLSGHAFYKFNKGDGYKPIFKLIDDRGNADKRAKKEAVHVSYDENIHGQAYDDFGIMPNEIGTDYLKDYDN